MKLSKTERLIVSCFVYEPNATFTIDELSEAIYVNRNRPKYWYQSVSAIMRVLILKLRAESCRTNIIRNSGLGSGQKASYKLDI